MYRDPISNDALSHYFCSFLYELPPCETDPFLYYSIPGVKKAALSLEEVGHSKASQSADIFTRKGRLSFECHPSLAMDELFLGELFGSEESDLGELDLLSEFLFKTQ